MPMRITSKPRTGVVKRTVRQSALIIQDDIPTGIGDVFGTMGDPSEFETASTKYVDVSSPFDPGNVWKIHGVFTPIPAWMRPFMFRILKPREIAVYVYICSYMRLAAISYVSLREMQRDFGLTNRHELIDACDNLERLGFLLRKKGRVAKARTEHDRSIYQRPALAHTLLTLLREEAIDGLFHPTVRACSRMGKGKGKTPPSVGKYIDKSLLAALGELIGKASVKNYLNKPTSAKATFLESVLVEKLADLRVLSSTEIAQDANTATTGSAAIA